jgi:hypothetical protein
VATSVVLLIVAARAGHAAGPEEDTFARNRVGVELGVGSALGELGVSYLYAPAQRFRLEGGLGWGFSGVQLSFMPKVVAGSGTCGFVAGFGPSLALGGPHAETGPSHEPQPGVIPFLNLDVPGLECHSDAGFSFQATLGLTMTLATFHYDVTDVGTTVHAGSVFPQLRFGLGYWF